VITAQTVWHQIKSGNQEAREEMVQAYAHLVKITVSKLVPALPPNLDQEDLIGAGYIGLIRAVDQYNPERGVKFGTYAISLIRGAVLDALRKEDWVPRTIRDKARTLQKLYEQLERRLGHPATDEEMAKVLHLDIDEFHMLLQETRRTSLVSLDDLLASRGVDEPSLSDSMQGDYPDPQRELERKEMRQTLACSLDALPERERIVLHLYYFEALTLKEIGRVLKISESRVYQLHGQAVRRLARQLSDRRALFTAE
jgi:RNA polymerase sigma factor for flagellar operon FliA